jgi:hypothetical protein
MKYFFSLFLLLTANAVMASNFYLGGSVGYGINYFEGESNDIPIRNPAHASAGFNAFIGYQVKSWYALELGYFKLGYYSNSGQGSSICDTDGTCGYPDIGIDPLRFPTNLNVVNEISANYYYLDNVFRLYQFKKIDFFVKVGIALNDVTLKSYVTVFPNSGGGLPIGFQINERIIAKPKNIFSPHLALGYNYNITENFALRSQLDYFFPTPMYSVQETRESPFGITERPSGTKQGTLYPIMITLGIDYRF